VANLKFLRNLRQQHYDISINTYPQSKIQYRVMARLINAPKRLSHRYRNYSRLDDWLTNLTIDEDYEIHCIENNLNLFKLMEVARPSGTLEMELFLSSAENDWAKNFCGRRNCLAKCWPGFMSAPEKPRT